MQRETTVRAGLVEPFLDGQIIAPDTNLLTDNAYLLHAQSGVKLFYRKGEGIVLDRPAGVADAEVQTWLDGSVRNAVASLNGYIPLHASGLLIDDIVVAFAGPSGAGKSTLAASLLGKLADSEARFFADDTIIMDAKSAEHAIVCLSGPARWKLNDQSMRFAGIDPQPEMLEAYGKYLLVPGSPAVRKTALLGKICVLTSGGNFSISSAPAASVATALLNDAERKHFYLQSFGRDYAATLTGFAKICQAVDLLEVRTANNENCFDEILGLIQSKLGRT